MNTPCCKIKPDYASETTEHGLVLNIELPGVLKENTKVTSEGSQLKVAAKRENNIPEDWQLINQAKITEEYELELELHEDFNLAETKASFANGILKLEIAKHEAVKPKQIEIIE